MCFKDGRKAAVADGTRWAGVQVPSHCQGLWSECQAQAMWSWMRSRGGWRGLT